MMKRIVLGILVSAAFLVGFSGMVDAWPVKGRQPHHGYFTNVLDTAGTDVFPTGAGPAGCRGDGVNAIPASVNSRQNFINFVLCKLNNGNTQERTGAAFIIQTMIGVARNRPPTAAQIAEWRSRVLNPSLQFRWNTVTSYTLNSFYQAAGSGPNPNDDAFYNENGSAPAIIFGSGANAYIIRRQCANPVGNGTLPTLPDPINFNMGGRSTADRTTVGPGQPIVFRHYLRNAGPSATNPTTINWTTQNTANGATIASGNRGMFAAGEEKQVQHERYDVPLNTPVGTQICRRITWNPDTQAGGSGAGAPVCVQVTALYNLTPSVQASTSTAQEGDSVTFTYFVSNSGPTASNTTTCKPVGNTYPPGHTPLPMQDNDRNSDPGYSPPSTSCPRTFPYSLTGANPPVNIGTETLTVSNVPTGSMLCRSLVVNPRSQSGGARASAESCVLIVKSPTVHFMGGDIAVGNPYNSASATCSLLANSGNIYTTANQRGGGSTAEYAAFVRGAIQFLQSSGYGFGTASQVGVDSASIRKLSFANTQSDAGEFGSNECMTDYYSKYSAQIPTTGSPGSRTLSGSDQKHYSGNLTINTSNIANGARILIVVDGNVTITGPIRYSGNYPSTSQIPSVAIIARGNITINSGVTQLDGAYISKGTVHTCDNTSGALTTNICQQQLTLNGVLMTDLLNLRRTFGADSTNFEQPAERFNYTTEMFFNNVLDDDPENRVETIEQRDLPPRY